MQVVTFDGYGVSGHQNHIATAQGVQLALLGRPDIALYELVRVGMGCMSQPIALTFLKLGPQTYAWPLHSHAGQPAILGKVLHSGPTGVCVEHACLGSAKHPSAVPTISAHAAIQREPGSYQRSLADMGGHAAAPHADCLVSISLAAFLGLHRLQSARAGPAGLTGST